MSIVGWIVLQCLMDCSSLSNYSFLATPRFQASAVRPLYSS